MLSISFKATYTLLDRFYTRRSASSYIQNIPGNIFEASKAFAHAIEDYDYLDVVVTNRLMLDEKYILFMDENHHMPITFKNRNNLTLLEFAILARKCFSIHKKEFEAVIEATCEDCGADTQKCITHFYEIINRLDNPEEDDFAEAAE